MRQSDTMQLFSQTAPWGLELTGFGRPIGLGFDEQHRLLVTDMDYHAVIRLDADLRHYQCHDGLGKTWGGGQKVAAGKSKARPRRPPGGWNGPHGVTTDGNGQLLVTCYYDPMIVALTPDGSARVLVGSEYLKGPATSRLDGQGRILVAEYALNLLLAFSPNGEYLGRLGLAPNEQILKFDLGRTGVPATTSPGGFDRLHMAMSTVDGLILVADTWNHRLQRFSAEGESLGCLSTGQGWNADTPPANPQFDSQIACPVAVDQSTAGQLLVTAWGSNQVLLFGPDGTPLSIGNLPNLNKPYDARFVGDGIVIADTHHGRVLVVDKIGLASA